MPFRAAFDCLWCGRSWQTRDPGDLEGWAVLCSDCLGKAGDNPFLAFRLRSGLAERSRGSAPAPGAGPTPVKVASPTESGQDIAAWFRHLGPAWDDRYLRRGRYSRGPVRDIAWEMELDAATQWLDRLPLRGEIVELAAGTGWWSPLLAGKGDLSLYDLEESLLDVARGRLVAHGLRAHLHVRDSWAEPDRPVDAVFTGFWLSLVPDARLDAFLGLVTRWLRPGGTFAFIDRQGDPELDAVGEAAPVDGLALRQLPDGRQILLPQVVRDPATLEAALRAAGFVDIDVSATARFFVLGSARR